MKNQIRVAVLGCGTIVKSQHLPAAIAHPEIELVALVDAASDRAANLMRTAHLNCKTSTDYASVFGEVDAVINALPNHLHAPATLDALNAGVHVLCEKPLATNSADARACAAAAAEKGLILAVGMNRRYQDNHRLLGIILEHGLIGALQGYDWQVGGPYDWNAASNFYFSKAEAGGGALIDYGVHLLDSLMDWFGPVTDFQYEDDDWGSGIEANVSLTLQHRNRYGPTAGQVRISRTYPLANRLLVRGSEATADLLLSDPDIVVLHRQIGGQSISETLRLGDGGKSSSNSFHLQLDNFVQSIRGVQSPCVDGLQAAAVLELIERCYVQRKRIPEPWSELEIISGAPA
jgi:UDP-N-acetylglucosamine 3-dehydrogenase